MQGPSSPSGWESSCVDSGFCHEGGVAPGKVFYYTGVTEALDTLWAPVSNTPFDH